MPIIEANRAKPNRIDATFVSTIGLRRSATRSTRGSRIRVWDHPKTTSRTAESISSPMTRAEPQPQVEVWASGSRSETRVRLSRIAPITSTRPPLRFGDSGTTRSTATKATTPPTAVIQKRAWKSKFSATTLASGSASAPPTPSIALISEIAEPTRSRGSVVASRLMPSGMVAIEAPWIARPTISSAMLLVMQVMREPTTSAARATRIIRRLPNMSPSRPKSGTATAPTSRVAVSSHSTLPTVVSRVVGNVASTGISSAWVSETIRAAKPTTRSSSRARAGVVWAATSASVAPSTGWPRWCSPGAAVGSVCWSVIGSSAASCSASGAGRT